MIDDELKNQYKFLANIGIKHEMECPNDKTESFIYYNKDKFERLDIKRPERTEQQKELDHIYGISDTDLIHVESGLRFSLTIHESYHSETWKIASLYVYTLKKTKEKQHFVITDGDFVKRIFYSNEILIPFDEVIKDRL